MILDMLLLVEMFHPSLWSLYWFIWVLSCLLMIFMTIWFLSTNSLDSFLSSCDSYVFTSFRFTCGFTSFLSSNYSYLLLILWMPPNLQIILIPIWFFYWFFGCSLTPQRILSPYDFYLLILWILSCLPMILFPVWYFSLPKFYAGVHVTTRSWAFNLLIYFPWDVRGGPLLSAFPYS